MVWSLWWPDERTEALRRMWAQGMTSGQIAEALKISRCAVMGKVHRLDLPGRKIATLTLEERNARRRYMHKARVERRAELKAKKEARAMLTNVVTAMLKPKPKRRPKPAPLPPDLARAVPLWKLEHGQCKWPMNEVPRGGVHLFCACPATGPYCEHHNKVAHAPKFGRAS